MTYRTFIGGHTVKSVGLIYQYGVRRKRSESVHKHVMRAKCEVLMTDDEEYGRMGDNTA